MTAPTGRAAKRDIMVALLVAGVPAVAGRVYRSRVWPISPGSGPTLTEVPALMVYASPETKRLETITSVDQQFTVSCEVVVVARAYPPPGAGSPEERLEAELEALAGAIETAVLTAPEMLNTPTAPERITEVRTELVMEPGSATLAGSAVLTFTLQWSEPWSMAEPPSCEDPTVTLADQPA